MRFLVLIFVLWNLCDAQNATIAAMTKIFPTASKSIVKTLTDQMNQESNLYDKPNACYKAYDVISPTVEVQTCLDFVYYLDSVNRFVTYLFRELPKKGTFTAFKAAELKTLWWNTYNQKANNFTTTSVEFLKKAENMVAPEKFCDLSNQVSQLIDSFEENNALQASDLFKVRL